MAEQNFKARVDAILAAAKEQTSVVASVATVISGSLTEIKRLTAQLAESGADTSELDEALSTLQGNTADLAKAAAVNTDAAAEVHVDDGGTGTAPAGEGGGTVVEPTPAPIEGAEDTGGPAGGGTAEG